MIEHDTTSLGAGWDIATHAVLDAAADVRARVRLMKWRSALGPYDSAALAADLKQMTDSLERVVTEAHRFMEHSERSDDGME